MAPFLSRQLLDDMAKAMEEAGCKGIDEILPFISRDLVGEMAQNRYAKGGFRVGRFVPLCFQGLLAGSGDEGVCRQWTAKLCRHSPLLDREFLTSLAKEALEKDGIKAIAPIAPFLKWEMLSEVIAEKYL